MTTEAGEFIVGAYLQHFCDCQFITYNARLPGGGVGGLAECDVVGMDVVKRTAFLCEVTTHLHGMRPAAVTKAIEKHRRQRLYAKTMLDGFAVRYQLWSPRVTPSQIIELSKIEGVELVVNGAYRECVEQLQGYARQHKHDTGNPIMRTLQIIAHLKT